MELTLPGSALIDQLFALNVGSLRTGDELKAAFDVADKAQEMCEWLLHTGLALVGDGCLWMQMHGVTIECNSMTDFREQVDQLRHIVGGVVDAIKNRVQYLNDHRFTCPICMESMHSHMTEPVHAAVRTESFEGQQGCRGAACRSCLREYVGLHVRSSTIACPMQNCGLAMHESDIQRLLTQENRQLRIAFLKETHAVQTAEDLARVLPLERNCKCGALVRCGAPHDDMLTVVHAPCHACGSDVHFDPKQTAVVQACPTCQVAVFKAGGCSSVVCICGCNFTWGSREIRAVQTFVASRSTHNLAPEIKLQRARFVSFELPNIVYDRVPTEAQVACLASVVQHLKQDMWCTDGMMDAMRMFASSFPHQVVFPEVNHQQTLVVVDFSDHALLDTTLEVLRPVVVDSAVELLGKPADVDAENWIRERFSAPFDMHTAMRAASTSQRSTIVVVGGWQNKQHCRDFLHIIEHSSVKMWKLVDLRRIADDELRFFKSSGFLN